MRSLLRVIVYLRPHRRLAFLTLSCAVGMTLLDLVPPWLVKIVIDRAIPVRDIWLLNGLILVILLSHVCRNTIQSLRIRFNNTLEQRVIYDMREALYRALQRLSLRYYEDRSTGELMARVNGDVNNLERILIDGVEQLVMAMLALTGVLAMLLIINWRLALLALIPIPVLIGGGLLFTTRVHALYVYLRRKLAEMNALLQDAFSGIRETMAFNRQAYELDRFNAKNSEYAAGNLAVATLWSLYSPGMLFLSAVGAVLVLWVGSRQVMAGQMTIGELVAFLSYLGLFYAPINQIHNINHMLQHALAAGERVFEILDAEPEVRESPQALTFPGPGPAKVQGYVRFDDVEFRYREGLPVLRGLTLEAAPGQRVAIVGSSGSGKTTLASLLLRFYDVDRGAITIDGYDVRRFSLEFLRAQTGLVRQDPFLFNGTVRENLAYGDLTATDEQMVQAAQAARAHDFIMKLPEQYDTWIGERGVKLSIGEKQRLTIARMLLKDPPIIILDEATSSVDTETEAEIQDALDALTRDRTTLIIAHRLSSLKMADRIVVLDDGRIVEEGTHEALLQRQGHYAALFEAQLHL